MWAILSDDMIDSSKVIGAARQAGTSARQCRTLAQLEAMLTNADLTQVVLDLQHPELAVDALLATIRLVPRPVKVVAYGSHVDAARLKAARDAGCDEVFARSQYLK